MTGIDISKDQFVACTQSESGTKTATYANDEQGIQAFITQLPAQEHCILEATGTYSCRLSLRLWEAGFRVSVINPLQLKYFARVSFKRAKTDPADAALLCEYGQKFSPPLWQPSPEYIEQLRQLRTVLEQHLKVKTIYDNHLHALVQLPRPDRQAKASLQGMIRQTEKQIKAVEAQMQSLAEQHCQELLQQLQSVPGIGKKTAIDLIIITQGFQKFSSSKKLAAYVGLCPRVYESGTSVKGRGAICKLGNALTRRLLYLCSWSAIKHNPDCQVFYQRLCQAGKAKKLALIAVANKLLRQVFAVARDKKSFVVNTQPSVQT